MAKSLRSKSMRKNRAQIRKSLSNPILKRRQEVLTAELQRSVDKRAGKSIVGLKATMFAKEEKKGGGAMEEDDDDEDDNVDEEDAESDIRKHYKNNGDAEAGKCNAADTKKMATKLLLKEKLARLKGTKKVHNHTKVLFEFK